MSNLLNIRPSDVLRMCFSTGRDATVQCRYFDHMITWCQVKHKTNTQTVIDSDSENASQDTYLTGNDINMYRNRLIQICSSQLTGMISSLTAVMITTQPARPTCHYHSDLTFVLDQIRISTIPYNCSLGSASANMPLKFMGSWCYGSYH